MTPSFSIVAFAADEPMSPRGERALAVAEAAARIAEVDLIAPAGGAAVRRRLRHLTYVVSPLMLDRWEPEAWRLLRRRGPRPDGALLVNAS